MSFHPDKCQALHFGKKWPTFYQLHGQNLQTTTEINYLGVTLANDLRWNVHVSNVANKASKTLGFIRRNLKIGSIKTKEKAYNAIVRPTLEYACQVWDPHTMEDKYTLEKVQRRAARWVVNRHRQTSSVQEMYEQLHWTPLEERRRQARLATYYKLHHGEISIESSHTPPLYSHDYKTRNSHDKQYFHATCIRNYRKYSFFPRTVGEWNQLPAEAISSASLESFKSRI
jgi:hypothetical protein